MFYFSVTFGFSRLFRYDNIMIMLFNAVRTSMRVIYDAIRAFYLVTNRYLQKK